MTTNPIQEGYNVLKSKLEETGLFKHIGMWNEDVAYMESDEAWSMPAVFIEFGEVTWQPMSLRGYRGVGEVYFHIVTSWAEGQYDNAWHYATQILKAVRGLDIESFGIFHLHGSKTNHSHEEVLETVECYQTRYFFTLEE